MDIRTVTDPSEKRKTARAILESLTEWFGITEAREDYIEGSASCPFFSAYDGCEPVGFICLRETGRDTAEIYVMGVLPDHHRNGAGRLLFEAARDAARDHGYSFLQVKTVRMGCYPCYDDTNRFYLAMGFKEFQVFPDLWDENNPCQVYVMAL
ncbi:MAG: GNAT family N-acetyltransferase [Oscillospiraceae bacterium]|nr:GNAT family N-acetyltransferase [Oscillospiraceae bacterium]